MCIRDRDIYQANYDFAKAKSAFIFKTIVDPFIGKYSLIKVCSGVLKTDDTMLNYDKEDVYKRQSIRRMPFMWDGPGNLKS